MPYSPMYQILLRWLLNNLTILRRKIDTRLPNSPHPVTGRIFWFLRFKRDLTISVPLARSLFSRCRMNWIPHFRAALCWNLLAKGFRVWLMSSIKSLISSRLAADNRLRELVIRNSLVSLLSMNPLSRCLNKSVWRANFSLYSLSALRAW